jgi:hypothetical protein
VLGPTPVESRAAGRVNICRAVRGLDPIQGSVRDRYPGAPQDLGSGHLQRCEEGRIVVLFSSVGYKTLSLEVVNSSDLLRPVT